MTHVAVLPDIWSTVCPFCGGSFAAPSPRTARASRSALVSALGLSLALTGCMPEGAPAPPPGGTPATGEPDPSTLQPAVYGGPPRDDLQEPPVPAAPPADGPPVENKPPEPKPPEPKPPEPKPPEPKPPEPKKRPDPPPPPPPPVDVEPPTPAAYGGPPRLEPSLRPLGPGDESAQAPPPAPEPVEIVPLYGVVPPPDLRRGPLVPPAATPKKGS
jgi:hypothetical protein